MDKFYSDSNTDIYCGDCLEIMPQLPKVDMILCDLPYGTSKCVGIELSEDYCAIAAARCVAANMGID